MSKYDQGSRYSRTSVSSWGDDGQRQFFVRGDGLSHSLDDIDARLAKGEEGLSSLQGVVEKTMGHVSHLLTAHSSVLDRLAKLEAEAQATSKHMSSLDNRTIGSFAVGGLNPASVAKALGDIRVGVSSGDVVARAEAQKPVGLTPEEKQHAAVSGPMVVGNFVRDDYDMREYYVRRPVATSPTDAAPPPTTQEAPTQPQREPGWYWVLVESERMLHWDVAYFSVTLGWTQGQAKIGEPIMIGCRIYPPANAPRPGTHIQPPEGAV